MIYRDTSRRYMRTVCTFVINVVIKLKQSEFSRNIFSQNTKVLGILVVNVIIKLQDRIIFGHILTLNMKASSMFVICVIIMLQQKEIFRCMLSLNIIKSRGNQSKVRTLKQYFYCKLHSQFGLSFYDR